MRLLYYCIVGDPLIYRGVLGRHLFPNRHLLGGIPPIQGGIPPIQLITCFISQQPPRHRWGPWTALGGASAAEAASFRQQTVFRL
jgi:hypothetical protein